MLATLRSVARRATAAVALTGAAVGVTLVAPVAAHASGNDYPYQAAPRQAVVDPWGFWERECVSFAAWRLHQRGVNLNNATQHWGNAYDWDNTAARLGYLVSTTPAVGAIAQWNADEASSWRIGTYTYSMTAGGYGHVGVVSAVYSDGTVQMEQYNMGNTGAYSTMRVRAPRYLWVGLRAPVPVYGAIGALYNAVGGGRSVLGQPVAPEGATPGGRVQVFQGGRIYWSSATGAHIVMGAILAHYLATGSSGGPLGLPTTNENATPDRVGRYNHFQHGSIYWTPTTGAHDVRAAIRDRWAALGWERSPLGYPRTDQVPTATGALNGFQGGEIVYDAATRVASVVR